MRGDDLKNKLVEAAAKLLKSTPAQTLSLRQVAKECGVSQAAPYRHFADKEALLAAVAAEGFLVLRSYMEEAIEAAAGDGEHAMHGIGKAYLRMGQKFPEHLKLMFGPYVKPSEAHQDLFVNAKLAFLTVVRTVQLAQKAGVVGEGDPFHRALHAWMAVHGFTLLFIDFHCDWLGLGKLNVEEAMHAFTRDLLQGYRVPLADVAGDFRLTPPPVPLELLRAARVDFEVVYG